MTWKGFTLLEMLIVVAILGIVASLAYPAYTQIAEHARGVEAIANLSAIHAGQRTFWLEQGEYADEIDQLGIDDPNDNSRRLFDYEITSGTSTKYTAKAVRNKKKGGNGKDTYKINQDGEITRPWD